MPPPRPQPAERPASAPPRGRLFTPMKTAIAALLLTPLVAAAAAPWWLSSPERLSRIVAQAVPELAGDVTFEQVRFSWLGPIVLEGVRVTPRDGGRSPLTIGRIEGSHGLLAILLSVGDLGRLTVEGLAADVVIDENHRTNLETLLPPRPAGPAAAPRAAKRSPVRMRLAVDKAVVRITAPWTTEPWVSDPITVRAALAPTAEGHSVWTVEPVTLLADARLEPPVAWGVLAYAAPVLADATRTSGRFSLELDGARLPVGDPAGGTLSGTLAMHEVVLGPGPLVEGLLQSLPGDLKAPPTILVADESHVRFELADRHVRHDGLEFGLPLPGPGRRLDIRSSGTVALDDQALDVKLVLPVPQDFGQERPLLAALAGKTISLGVAGKLGAPQVVFDGSIGRMAGEVARDLIDRGQGDKPAAGSTGEVVAEIVGGVIDEIARRRAARKAAEEAGETPPRRERLRDRILRRPPGDTPPPAASPPAPETR